MEQHLSNTLYGTVGYSDRINCVCGHYVYICWAKELHVRVARESSLTNFWAVILGVSVSTMPRTPSLSSLFLTWVFFSLAFNTVFQVFLTTFLFDSDYETPIQNIDELLAWDIKLAYPPEVHFIFEKVDETDLSNVLTNHVICPSFEICVNWAKHQKNASVLLFEKVAEENYAGGILLA
jgi:hypothetical protein